MAINYLCEKLIDFILKKSSPYYSMGLCLLSFLILISPIFLGSNQIAKLNDLFNYREKYLVYIIITFIISFVISCAHYIRYLVKNYQKTKNEKIEKQKKLEEENIIKQKKEKRLNNLTNHEKKILLFYIENNTRTQNLSLWSGIVAGLIKAEILYHARSYPRSMTEGKAYINIEDWAFDYLKEHKEILT